MDRRIVGIDLGTTHTVVAWAGAEDPTPRVFDVPQLVTADEVEARPLLPSCLYAPLDEERARDPWAEPPWITGEYARRRGVEVPGRVVLSAKSWLCHSGVDRGAPLLPWGAAEGTPRVSPIEATRRYLAHVRRAWDEAHPAWPLAEQDVVLTVPASFDVAARELTLEAARAAGLGVKLLEEPQAAFYDFLQSAGEAGLERLLTRAAGGTGAKDALVLVCDVGGGTTDLSLIRVAPRPAPGQPFAVERLAVGHHLLLGGDNMDIALALACEPRLVGGGDARDKLDPPRFAQLVSACRAAKERLLAGDALEVADVAVLGAGAKLVGSTKKTSLTRDEAERIVLDGFFPPAARDARPERTRSGLVAFGLPYERDVAVTRHVAWFFARHAPEGAHPDALLLNGGVFRARTVAERLTRTLASWGGPPVELLPFPDPDLAVARGAVAYGLALRGLGARIEGGAPSGYYVGLDVRDERGRRGAVCVVPRGAREGVMHRAADRPLALVVGRPVRFDLFASDAARTDGPGDLVWLDDDAFTRLPPVAAAFGGEGGAGARGEVRVTLEGELTPVGTLDLACVTSTDAGAPARRFRLAFQIRDVLEPSSAPTSRREGSVPPTEGRLEQASQAIDRVFGKPRDDVGPREAKDVLRTLERLLGERASWTMATNRALFDAVAPLARARRRSPDHERLFWLLAGFTIRPGYGDPLDPGRVLALARLFPERLAFPDNPRGWQQFWIAWRRAAGGLDERAQGEIRDMVDPFLAPPEAGLRRPKKATPQALDEALEMASSLERVPVARRRDLGSWILERTWTDRDPRLWAALGRLGARAPAYASVHHVVAPLVAERWLDHLLREKWDEGAALPQAAAQIARMTGDRARDVGDKVRSEVEKKLAALPAGRPEWLRAVREVVPVDDAERASFLGEGLPMGLKLA